MIYVTFVDLASVIAMQSTIPHGEGGACRNGCCLKHSFFLVKSVLLPLKIVVRSGGRWQVLRG